jgi:hypothetical protein
MRHPNRLKIEAAAARAARNAGWVKRRIAGYWTHPDHATWDGPASELCRHYNIYVKPETETV